MRLLLAVLPVVALASFAVLRSAQAQAPPLPVAGTSPVFEPGASASMPVAQMGLMTACEGWATTCQGLFLTGDGGRTWKDITPPNLRKVSCVSDHVGAVATLGRSQLWVSAINVPWLYVGACRGCINPPGAGLDHTTDAGTTWRSTGACGQGGCAFSEMSFSTPVDGIGLDGYIASTNDGGQRWRLAGYGIGRNLSAVARGPGGVVWAAIGEPSPPLHGHGELARLLVGRGCACTLATAPVALPALPGRGAPLAVGAPVFFGPRDGVVAARTAGPSRNGALVVYTTADGGSRWTAHEGPPASPARYPDDGEFDLPFAAASAKDWVFDLGSVLYRTSDAGGHWVAVTPQGRGSDPVVFAVDFATPHIGWSLAASDVCSEGVCRYVPHLYATSDGGANWRELTPR